jgi:hypothetical protein
MDGLMGPSDAATERSSGLTIIPFASPDDVEWENG